MNEILMDSKQQQKCWGYCQRLWSSYKWAESHNSGYFPRRQYRSGERQSQLFPWKTAVQWEQIITYGTWYLQATDKATRTGEEFQIKSHSFHEARNIGSHHRYSFQKRCEPWPIAIADQVIVRPIQWAIHLRIFSPSWSVDTAIKWCTLPFGCNIDIPSRSKRWKW